MLQAEGAVGCRRLIASATAAAVGLVVVARAGAALHAVAAPAAFTPLPRRDDDDAPAGVIAGTRVRSIGVERRVECAKKVERKVFVFFLCLLIDLERRKKRKNEKKPPSKLSDFFLFFSWFTITRPHSDNTNDDDDDDDDDDCGDERTGRGARERDSLPLALPRKRVQSLPTTTTTSVGVSSSPLALAPHGLDRAHEAAAPEALAELLGLGLRDPGDDDGGAEVVGLLHDLFFFNYCFVKRRKLGERERKRREEKRESSVFPPLHFVEVER